jgi:hypothetical protein
VELSPDWNPNKEVLIWTPELIATVDATLAGTVTKHVGVQQGGGQEAEEDDGAEDILSTNHSKRRLKLAWWEQRTQWHYRHWKQFKKAFVAYWVAESERWGNMAMDEQPAKGACSSQAAASGGTGKVGAAFGQPPPLPTLVTSRGHHHRVRGPPQRFKPTDLTIMCEAPAPL